MDKLQQQMDGLDQRLTKLETMHKAEGFQSRYRRQMVRRVEPFAPTPGNSAYCEKGKDCGPRIATFASPRGTSGVVETFAPYPRQANLTYCASGQNCGRRRKVWTRGCMCGGH